ncbi:MAG: hypothetical protein OXC13_19505 [Caldilineaceae bacterium]|nr:hypothetical protein [Caldilineaceae bacterium]
MNIWLQELLGIVVAWLEVLFILNVLDLAGASLFVPTEDWLPLLSGPKKTLLGMDWLLPSALVGAYEEAVELLADLMPFKR